MPEEFKALLIEHAEKAVDRAPHATSEAATQQYLILPFFQLLGYDPLNPSEVIPEAHASFSDKFRNRVDYAICKNGDAVMAVEAKKAGTVAEAHRGELKGYFNAVATVKLGILTDGIVYEMYSDTGRENMMDDDPFARIDLREVAEGRIEEPALDALLKLRKGTFDPADVGADAKRKLLVSSYVEVLDRHVFSQPTDDVVRLLMDLAGVEGRKTQRLVDEHAPAVADALQAFFDKKILERVGFADREDLVRVQATPSVLPAEVTGESPDASLPGESSGIITTETERAVFTYVKTRLAYLVEEEELFRALDGLGYVDRKTLFTVFYQQERKGRIFNFREGSRGPRYRFEFSDLNITAETDNLTEIDEPLLKIFRQRVQEMA